MIWSRTALMLVGWTTAYGCAGLGVPLLESTAADAVIGCYALDRGAWVRDDVPLGNLSAGVTPPDTFQLSATIGVDPIEDLGQVVRPVIQVADGHPSAYWQRLENDSLYVRWTNGFYGVGLHLRIAVDSLHGYARAETDAPVRGRSRPQAAVIARRIPCSEIIL